MIDLKGKVAVVFGLANKRSIAWGIAQKLSEAGATLAICYQNERLKKEADALIPELKDAKAYQCDVSVDAEIDSPFATLKETYGTIHILVHAASRRRHAGDLDGRRHVVAVLRHERQVGLDEGAEHARAGLR